MKKVLFIIVLLISFVSFTAVAEDEKSGIQNYDATTSNYESTISKNARKAQWEVSINIKYNSVDRAEAIRIIDRIIANNEAACKVDVSTKKVDENFGSIDLSSQKPIWFYNGQQMILNKDQ